MFELLKKGLFAGLGLAVVTKEHLEKSVNKLVDDGKLSRDEAEKMLSEVLESGEKQWQEMEGFVKDLVKRAVDGIDICTKKEMEELKQTISNLEDRLSRMEDKAEGNKEQS